MKSLLIAALSLLVSASALGAQDAGRAGPKGSLYIQALEAALTPRASDPEQNPDSPPRADRVIVYEEMPIDFAFPARIAGTTIEPLSFEELRARYRSLAKPISLIQMQPMYNEGDRLVFFFSRFQYSEDERRRRFETDGGTQVVLRHDCATNAYVVESVESFSI